MEDYDGFLSKRIEKTRILPLRWFGNLCNSISSNSLVKAFMLQDNNNFGFRFKFHSKVWHYVNKPYERWGTYYLAEWIKNDPVLEKLGSDYDENGVAYWEKWTDSDSLES